MPKQPITRRWTEEDIAHLLQLIEEGATLMRAAAALNRGTASVQKKARSLGKQFDGVRQVRANLKSVGAFDRKP